MTRWLFLLLALLIGMFLPVQQGVNSTLTRSLGHPLQGALASFATWIGLGTRFAWQRLSHTSHAPRHVAEMILTSFLIPWISLYWRARGAWRFRVPFV